MSRYIDADEVLEQIRKKLGIKSLDYLLEAERQIVTVIQSMPSIDIEPKRGEWIEVQISEHFKRMICSKCGDSYVADAITPLEVWINNRHCFCPSCGADMRGVDDE